MAPSTNTTESTNTMESAKSTPEEAPNHVKEEDEVSLVRIVVLMTMLAAIMFLVGLDRTVVAVAVPEITDEFGSIDDIGWYGSAYMLASASLQLLSGRIYKFYPIKPTFMIAIVIFEVGSAVCGAAPSSVAFIVGRVIAGSGASGIFSGAIQTMIHILPLRKRPIWQAIFAMVAGVSSALGPLVGGAFTTKVTWRWCFYINLPFGGVVLLAVFFLLQIPKESGDKKEAKKASRMEKIKRLDPVGFLLLVPCITCSLLALQYGGFVYSWSNARLIVLWIMFGVTLLAFLFSQWYFDEMALLPPRIFLKRSVQGAFWYIFLLYGSMMIMIYYIPIYFQVVKGSRALESSYQSLPSVISLVVAAIIAGTLARKTGYYTPQMLMAPILSSIGVGLMTTWESSTNSPHWIGYQILFGFGLGLGMQGSSLSVQTVLVRADVPIGMACIFFAQQMGGSIFVSVGQNLLANKLEKDLSGVPGLSGKSLASLGATQIRNAVPSSELPLVVNAYNAALHNVWYAALALCCAIVVPFALIEWRNIKKDQPGSMHEAKKQVEEESKNTDPLDKA